MSIIQQMALEAIRNNGGEPLDEASAIILLQGCIEHIGMKLTKALQMILMDLMHLN